MPCPRCNRKLFVSHNEYWCVAHGTVYTPWRAWDGVAVAPKHNKADKPDETLAPKLRKG